MLMKGGFETLTLILSVPCYPEKEWKFLRQFLESIMKQLQREETNCMFTKQTTGDRCLYYCSFPDHKKKEFTISIGQCIAEYFFDEVKKSIIPQLIHDQYQSPYPEDMDEIKKRVDQIYSTDPQMILAKKESFAQSIHQFLEANPFMAIDGYLRFRTKPYRAWFRSIVQRAIDEYLLDREYREFIQLLKYFVSIQKSRFLCVHVIHKESKKFQLLKEDGTPIYVNELDRTFHEMISQSFSGEDFIVGALLSTAPEQVVLHTSSPEENIIRTLLQIFDGRITLCLGCHRCFSM